MICHRHFQLCTDSSCHEDLNLNPKVLQEYGRGSSPCPHWWRFAWTFRPPLLPALADTIADLHSVKDWWSTFWELGSEGVDLSSQPHEGKSQMSDVVEAFRNNTEYNDTPDNSGHMVKLLSTLSAKLGYS